MSKRQDSNPLYDGIRSLVLSARQSAARGVDLLQVYTNFEIGRRVFEQEQKGEDRAGYGKELLNELSARLSAEFGSGFSTTNLKCMRQFYLAYPERVPRIGQTPSGQFPAFPILQTLSGISARTSTGQTVSDQFNGPQIGQSLTDQLAIGQSLSGQLVPSPRPFALSWSHYVFLLGAKNADERSFYEIEATNQNWTVRELKRQFNSGLYERLALSRDKEGIRRLAQEGQIVAKASDLFEEPLVLEFLGLDERSRYSESDLESAIISQIERFLLEMGRGFLFESRQKRFTFDEDHFFVDLVFYNRLLRCYVLLFDRFVKTAEEHPTVGILLCRQKNKALVEITLPKDANIHAREYQLYLPSKDELQQKLMEWIGEQETGDE